MRYGAMNFPVKPVLEEASKIADLGFDYLELAMDPPSAHHTRVDDVADELARILEERELGLICHLPTFVYTADLSPGIRKASLEEMIASLQTASRLNAEKAVLHPSIISGLAGFVPKEVEKLALESLALIQDQAMDLGLCLCLENMFPRYRDFFEPDRFSQVFDRFPDLKMTLDTGHANLGDPGGTRLFDFLDRFGDRIAHVHVSDNKGIKDDHLRLGMGNLDVERFARHLSGIGYDDTITLEIFSSDTADLEESRKTLASLLR